MAKVGNIEVEVQIIEKTKEMILERGFKGWNMDDLAFESGVAKRTLYKIIGKKEELIARIYLDNTRRTISNVKELLNSNKEYKEMLYEFSEEFPRYISAFALKTMVQLRREFPQIGSSIDELIGYQVETFKKLYQRGIDQGIFRSELNGALIVETINSLIRHFIQSGRSEAEFEKDLTLVLHSAFKGFM
ncbi:MAG: TetR/AcrR family transcriptional regulator [Marinifilaceae bacterium]|jgi:AcrR family transcriptional regulator